MGCFCSCCEENENLRDESFNSLPSSTKREKFLKFIEYLRRDNWKSEISFLYFDPRRAEEFERVFTPNNLSVLSGNALLTLIRVFTDLFILDKGVIYLEFGTKGDKYHEKHAIWHSLNLFTSILNIFENFNNSISVFHIESLSPLSGNDEYQLLFLAKFREKLRMLRVFLPKLKESIEIRNSEIKKKTQKIKDDMINEKFLRSERVLPLPSRANGEIPSSLEKMPPSSSNSVLPHSNGESVLPHSNGESVLPHSKKSVLPHSKGESVLPHSKKSVLPHSKGESVDQRETPDERFLDIAIL